MAAKKRKPTRSSARKMKKSSVRKKLSAGKSRKMKGGSKKPVLRLVRTSAPTSVDKAYTKGLLYGTLAGCTGLQRKEISTVFDELGNIIAAHLKKQGPGQFTLPGLVKISVKYKPATKARKGKNPFTGEEMMFKAKAARYVVKVRPLQRLKGMV